MTFNNGILFFFNYDCDTFCLNCISEIIKKRKHNVNNSNKPQQFIIESFLD